LLLLKIAYLSCTCYPSNLQAARLLRVRTLRRGQTSNDYFVFGRTGSQIYTQKPAILTGVLVFLLGLSTNSSIINSKPTPDERQAFLCNNAILPHVKVGAGKDLPHFSDM